MQGTGGMQGTVETMKLSKIESNMKEIEAALDGVSGDLQMLAEKLKPVCLMPEKSASPNEVVEDKVPPMCEMAEKLRRFRCRIHAIAAKVNMLNSSIQL